MKYVFLLLIFIITSCSSPKPIEDIIIFDDTTHTKTNIEVAYIEVIDTILTDSGKVIKIDTTKIVKY